MASQKRLPLFVVLIFVPSLGEASGVNPIRRVVTLLQQMQQKVTVEGENEEKAYKTFMCWCNSGAKDLGASIAEADAKISSLGADIQEATEKHSQTKADLLQHESDRAAAIKTMTEAEAIRQKEADEYAKEKAEHGANAAAIDKAVKALEKGMAGGFLQTHAADVLRQLAQRHRMDTMDRKDLLSFLSGSSEYAPGSGPIVGILKQIQDEMHAGYTEATEMEEAKIKAHRELMAVNSKQKELASAAIETKTAKAGELGVAIAQMKNDKEDTQEAMLADNKFAAGVEKSCKTKTAEWEERSKLRSEELVALADTIKVLNDDDALSLFKKSLPGPGASFVQVRTSVEKMRALVMASLRRDFQGGAHSSHRAALDVILLALRGKKVGFEKVIAMISAMQKHLRTEQQDDDSKLEYCGNQLDRSDDQKKQLERRVSDLKAAIAAADENVATFKEEISALTSGIHALDKSVSEATENRKTEHEEYQELMSTNTAAKEVLLFAKNRLQKFYNPRLYKVAAKRELSAEDRVAVNMGGTPPPTAAPGGIAGTGITALVQVTAHSQHGAAPPPPPETFGAYQKKSSENNGVLAMIDMLIRDLEKQMTVAETEEKEAQADYEELAKDSAEKRSADGKSLAEKEAAKADTEAALEKHGDDMESTGEELSATLAAISSLHGECDFVQKYHGVRKEARDSEIDALGKATAVLSGADFSLVQTRARTLLRGGS